MSQQILVTGAGGFIGGHLVSHLLKDPLNKITCVDIKPLENWYQLFNNTKNFSLDLSKYDSCKKLTKNINIVYNLAADMGGMGFIENNKADCMLSVLINSNLLLASKKNKINKYFFSSSACVYSSQKQSKPDLSIKLKEDDIFPIDPEDGYGWEKLFSERMCRHFYEDFNIDTKVARYHNVYGPKGTFDGGREKAPAAICRKVIEAKINNQNSIEIWGDGSQVRSFLYIDDCIQGTLDLVNSNVNIPLNIGSEESVTINQLVDIVESIANIKLIRKYQLNQPKGVAGRSSDNSLTKNKIAWSPTTSLKEGLEKTYRWIYDTIVNK